VDLKRADLLLAAIARGDALGVTSEGLGRDGARALLRQHRDRGWPLVPVGSDELGAGRTTRVTAQAQALQRAFLLANGRFDGAVLAQQLQALGRASMRAFEPSMHKALADLDGGVPWWRGGERAFAEVDAEPGSCDAVARAIPMAALVRDDAAALRAARLQAMVTDWHPDAVDAAAALVWLLRRAFAGDAPWRRAWRAEAEAAIALPAAVTAADGEDGALATWQRTVAARRTYGAGRARSGDDAFGTPWQAVALAVATARMAEGLAPEHAAVQALSAELPEYTGAQTPGLVAALGGRATVNTACAAALVAAAGHVRR